MIAIVLAHGKAEEAVVRHAPNWQATFDQIIALCPSDDPIEGAMPLGLSGDKFGVGHIERLCFAIAIASRFESAAIMEYDTLVFPGFGNPPRNGLACSEVFSNDNPRFTANKFGHSPWVASGESWWKILCAGAGLELGVPDRWLGMAAQNAGVPLYRIEGAFSKDGDWSTFDAMEALQAKLRGAPAIHGIKTIRDFHTLQIDQ